MRPHSFLLTAGIALALASCDNSSYEVHQTFFYPQQPGGMVTYADQTQDTLHVYSIDSWTGQSSASWLDFTPKSYTASYLVSVDTRLRITLEPNTTGALRTGYITISSYDVISMPVNQYPWLNIARPTPTYYYEGGAVSGELEDMRVRHDLVLLPEARDTSVVFRTYQDGATLQSDVDWLVPAETEFVACRDTVKLSVASNTTGAQRTGTLTLTSGGISSIINVTQPPVR